MFKRNLYILVLFSFLLACSNEQNGSVYSYEDIDDNLYPLLFSKNSFWIYSRTGDHLIDSISLINKTSFDSSPLLAGGGSSIIFKVFKLSYQSSIHGNYEHFYKGYVIAKGTSNSGNFIYLASHKTGEQAENAKIEKIFDSMNINGYNYYNVVMMKVEKDKYIANDLNLYFVDSLGIVKKEILSNDSIMETWELEEYNTVFN